MLKINSTETGAQFAAPRLLLTLPLPPTDNQLIRRGGAGGAYPTRVYQDWLEICRPILQEAIQGMPPRDPQQWWSVVILVNLPKGQRDPQNHQKAILDLISGHTVNPERRVVDGRDIPKGRIICEGGFWRDDRRTREVRSVCSGVGYPEGTCRVLVEPASAPLDYQELQKAQAIKRIADTTCPDCGAKPGHACRGKSGNVLRSYHQERKELGSQ